MNEDRPDSIRHSPKTRAAFRELYEAARRELAAEQAASESEISITHERHQHPDWAVRRVEEGLGP